MDDSVPDPGNAWPRGPRRCRAVARSPSSSPAFRARLWQFVADVSDEKLVTDASTGTVVLPQEVRRLLAWVIAGIYVNQLTEHISESEDLRIDEARARARDKIDEQRRIWGSLALPAAGEEPHAGEDPAAT